MDSLEPLTTKESAKLDSGNPTKQQKNGIFQYPDLMESLRTIIRMVLSNHQKECTLEMICNGTITFVNRKSTTTKKIINKKNSERK
jgi:hypothetical protein